jgi:hypothetical protein
MAADWVRDNWTVFLDGWIEYGPLCYDDAAAKFWLQEYDGMGARGRGCDDRS